jgi:hypothetical protein
VVAQEGKREAALSPRCSPKHLIFIAIIASFGTPACAGLAQSQKLARISELEVQNEELERQLMLLKESNLSEERSHCNSGAPGESSPKSAEATVLAAVVAAPEREGAPRDLPVVRLSPGTHGSQVQSGGDESVVTAQLEVEAVEADSAKTGAPNTSPTETRTVLKVHGSAEGRVYDRALTAADTQSSSAL